MGMLPILMSPVVLNKEEGPNVEPEDPARYRSPDDAEDEQARSGGRILVLGKEDHDSGEPTTEIPSYLRWRSFY